MTASSAPRPFHLSITVTDLEKTRMFYGDLLGCAPGRELPGYWIDFDWHGNQLSFHLDPNKQASYATGKVDGAGVPVPHFGAVLALDEWRALQARLIEKNVTFFKEPHIRYEGEPGEQRTMFLQDPSGNMIEIKGFADMGMVFVPNTKAA